MARWTGAPGRNAWMTAISTGLGVLTLAATLRLPAFAEGTPSRDITPRGLQAQVPQQTLPPPALPAAAEELQPYQTYPGGTRVDSSSVGVSFVIPQGWVGRFGQDAKHHVLMLGSNTIEGVGIVNILSGTTAAQITASLTEPQDLGAGVVLRPTGPPATRGSRMATRYQNEAYVGLALALLGPTRNSVIFFFAGPPKNERAYLSLLEGLGTSTNFLEPAPATAQPQPPASGGLDPEWSNRLTGQALNYFSSYQSGGGGGGMASHRVLHLCANGRFAYSGDSLVTMNVPGASGSSGGRDGARGRWSLESPTQSTAVLVLAVEGGQELRWQLRYDGNKTFLNGQRWLREPSKACR